MTSPADFEGLRLAVFEAFAFLCAPIRGYLEDGSRAPGEVQYLRAQFRKDMQRFAATLGPFQEFRHEVNAVSAEAYKLESLVLRLAESDSRTNARAFYDQTVQLTRAAILGLPSEPLLKVFPAGSPLAFYLWLRGVCSATKQRVALLEPWVSADLFHRYFAEVPDGVHVVVVVGAHTRSKPEWPAFASVARVFATQRSFDLRLDPTLHDRWLIADSTAYSIGNSIKDAAFGKSCGVEPADFATIDAMVAAARPIGR